MMVDAMNCTKNFQHKHLDNSRCICCGMILLKQEKVSGYCFRHFREIPYQKVACNLLVESYRAVGDEHSALEVSNECLHYFPSNMLRR